MNNYKDILLKILDAIGYADDREAFVNEFIGNVQKQAVVDLIQTLPADKQEEIKKEFSSAAGNPEKIAEVVKKYFTEDQMRKALEEASKNAVIDWMDAVKDTLSDAQRTKLIDLSGEFAPSASPAPISE
jgi:phage host-nuclease inhibitor protein Gam